jgi:hypothetical protein
VLSPCHDRWTWSGPAILSSQIPTVGHIQLTIHFRSNPVRCGRLQKTTVHSFVTFRATHSRNVRPPTRPRACGGNMAIQHLILPLWHLGRNHPLPSICLLRRTGLSAIPAPPLMYTHGSAWPTATHALAGGARQARGWDVAERAAGCRMSGCGLTDGTAPSLLPGEVLGLSRSTDSRTGKTCRVCCPSTWPPWRNGTALSVLGAA